MQEVKTQEITVNLREETVLAAYYLCKWIQKRTKERASGQELQVLPEVVNSLVNLLQVIRTL